MSKFQDLSGEKIGHLTILYRGQDYIQPSGQHKIVWHCVCDCGNECNVRASDIKSGNTTSCGCMSSRKKSTGLENLIGKEFGDFIILNRAPNRITPSGQKTRVWHCRCKLCGIERDIQASQLKKFSGKCTCNKFKPRDLVGKTYNYLKIISFDKNCDNKNYWNCICLSCGKEISIEEKRIINGKKISCGCQEKLISYKKRLEQTSISKENLMYGNSKLASEFHPTQNKNLTSDKISMNSNKKIWWLGACGHEWQATVYSRNSNGTGCPFCANQKLLKGFNDFETWCKNNNRNDLLEEWDYKNNILNPSDYILKSGKKVWWKCKNGHSYYMRISSRNGNQNSGCPYCSTPIKKILVGFNDLQTTHPSIMKEWDYEKNKISPTEVSAGSGKKVWWKCKRGHMFEQSIAYKTSSKLSSTCPYCSNQKLLKGFNDFETWCRNNNRNDLLEEWDYKKNEKMPYELGIGKNEKIWWMCPFGHSYQAYPSNRCGSQHSGCPVCDKENHTSFPEQALLYYIKKYFPDTINSDRNEIGMELDIFIPSVNVAIEYDGVMWHKETDKDKKKNLLCLRKNITLIRIREKGLNTLENCKCIFREDNRSDLDLSITIKNLLSLLGKENINVNVEQDTTKIYSSYIFLRKSKSLAKIYPDISKEWHPNKNGLITPEMVAPVSNKKVWWLGSCGHEYLMSISTRTNSNCGCPYCNGKRVLPGFNDLETWCQNNNRNDLLEEWDYEKNKLLPSEITKSSDKKVYWKCNHCNHRWITKIDSRTRMNSKCPKCASYYRNAKAVINLDTVETYESILEASQKYKINRTCISNVCRGKQKKAGGFRWKFK